MGHDAADMAGENAPDWRKKTGLTARPAGRVVLLLFIMLVVAVAGCGTRRAETAQPPQPARDAPVASATPAPGAARAAADFSAMGSSEEREVRKAVDTFTEISSQHSELSVFIPVLQRSMEALSEQQAEYARALQAMGWAKIFDPDRLLRDKNLAESKAMVAKAEALAKSNRRALAGLLEQLQRDVSGIVQSPAEKKAVATGFERSKMMAMPFMDRAFAVEERSIARIGDVIAFLAARQGRWSMTQGGFTFASAADSAEYSRLARSIQDCVVEQQAIQQEYMAVLQQALDGYRRAAARMP